MKDISVQELAERIRNQDDLILIDVRESYERDEFNIGGELASLQSGLPDKIAELKGRESDEIVVYCRSGNRSGMAKMMFEQAGFTNVRNLLGGMIAWQEAYPS